MTKTNIKQHITRNRKDLMKIRKGEVPSYYYQDWSMFYIIRDEGFKYVNKLREKGLTKSDQSRIDAFINEVFRTSKFMMEKVG